MSAPWRVPRRRGALAAGVVAGGVLALAGCASQSRASKLAATEERPHVGVTVIHHVGDGHGDPELEEVALPEPDAPPAVVEPGAPSRHGGDAVALAGRPPDPAPIATRKRWEYHVIHDGGRLCLGSIDRVEHPAPVETDRRMGRFAVEIWVGRELVDRARFDFPLLADAEPPDDGPRPFDAPPTLSGGIHAVRAVSLPATDCPTRALLLDRASGQVWALPWPPDSGRFDFAPALPLAVDGACPPEDPALEAPSG